MVQATEQPLSFEAFLDQSPSDGGRYELIEGEVVEVRPTGAHEDIGGFIALKLGVLIAQATLPLTILRTCVVRPSRPNAGYIPDVKESVQKPGFSCDMHRTTGKAQKKPRF